jgi:hypothetical protein
MMYLIQLFLPVYDETGTVFPEAHFAAVRKQLTDRFGGVTAYSRAPAQGFWKEKGTVHRDDIVVFEVMTKDLDKHWWESYRQMLEVQFRQQEVLIRSQSVEII